MCGLRAHQIPAGSRGNAWSERAAWAAERAAAVPTCSGRGPEKKWPQVAGQVETGQIARRAGDPRCRSPSMDGNAAARGRTCAVPRSTVSCAWWSRLGRLGLDQVAAPLTVLDALKGHLLDEQLWMRWAIEPGKKMPSETFHQAAGEIEDPFPAPIRASRRRLVTGAGRDGSARRVDPSRFAGRGASCSARARPRGEPLRWRSTHYDFQPQR